MSDWYFAYGSNMNPARVAARGMAYRQMCSGQLADYQLYFNKRATGKQGVAYANLDHQCGAVAEGVLYQLMAAEDIQLMDPYEGYPVRYRRECLSVQTPQGSQLAWVYLANPQMLAAGLLPERVYLDHLLAGKDWYSDAHHQWLSSHPCIESAAAGTRFNGLTHNA